MNFRHTFQYACLTLVGLFTFEATHAIESNSYLHSVRQTTESEDLIRYCLETSESGESLKQQLEEITWNNQKQKALQLSFEESMAKCLFNTVVNYLAINSNDKLIALEQSLKFDPNRKIDLKKEYEKRRESLSNGYYSKNFKSEEEKRDLVPKKDNGQGPNGGSFADQAAYALYSVAKSQLRKEALFYSKEMLMDGLCEPINQIILRETCNRKVLDDIAEGDFRPNMSWSFLFMLAENDLKYFSHNTKVADYIISTITPEEASQYRVHDDSEYIDIAQREVYKTNIGSYGPALLRIMERIHFPEHLAIEFESLRNHPSIIADISAQISNLQNKWDISANKSMLLQALMAELSKLLNSTMGYRTVNLIEGATPYDYQKAANRGISRQIEFLLHSYRGSVKGANVSCHRADQYYALKVTGRLKDYSKRNNLAYNPSWDEIVCHLYLKNSQAFTGLIDLLDLAENIAFNLKRVIKVTRKITTASTTLLEASFQLESNQFQKGITTLVKGSDSIGISAHNIENIYWLAQVADAKTAEELELVLSEFTSDLGSYREKSKRGLTNSITASLGGGYRMDGFRMKNGSQYQNDGYITSKVGYMASFKNPYLVPGNGYSGFRVNLFDFTSGFTEEEDIDTLNGYFESVVSPSFGVFVSLGKSPIILSMDYGQTKINQTPDGEEINEKAVTYLSFSIEFVTTLFMADKFK